MSTQRDERPTYEGVCPFCGRAMERVGDELRCADGRCKGRRPLPLHVRLDVAGAARLPGF